MIKALFLAMALSPLCAHASKPETGQGRLLCDPVYMPTQAVWPREVTIEYDDKRVKEVRIDGLKVYKFDVNDTWIFTALDNERIQINVATLTWTSDFRGLAKSQGRCEWVDG